MFLLAPVILPAFAISTNASTYISVWTPKSFKSDSAIRDPTAFGIPPIPSCKQAPSGIWSTISFATAWSTSVAAPPPPNSSIAGLFPSTIISTLEIWIPSSNPPRQRGIFSLTSTITHFAFSSIAAVWDALGPKLKYPWASIGATCIITTSVSGR